MKIIVNSQVIYYMSVSKSDARSSASVIQEHVPRGARVCMHRQVPSPHARVGSHPDWAVSHGPIRLFLIAVQGGLTIAEVKWSGSPTIKKLWL